MILLLIGIFTFNNSKALATYLNKFGASVVLFWP
jgi:hypothetical protein